MNDNNHSNNDITLGRTMYEEIHESVDNETGEIISRRNSKVVKKSSTPEFVMLFTKSSPALLEAKLTTGQTTLLFNILSGNYISRDNYLDISPATKEEISNNSDISRGSINTLLSQLVKKNIIMKKKLSTKTYRYYLNPFIFGKGSWNNIEKLRYETSLEYDFKENTSIENRKTATTLEDASEILTIPHHISNTQEYTEDGVVNQVIELEETPQKEQVNPNQGSLPLFEENKESNNDRYKLDLIREENKQLQLKQELMKEESKLLEMKIKAKEMGL